jgi:molybdopterin/thiamine biosynthesis adenylyltransferase
VQSAPRLPSQAVENSLDRFARQMRLAGFGEAGQRRLGAAQVLVAGCGALGTVVCEQLVRAGVGTVTIVDRDVVDRSNLQRQTLFSERDADRGTPKAEAAKARLMQIRSDARVRAVVDDLRSDNVLRICREHHMLVDCLDNFETRYVLNDCSVALGVPLVYGGAVGFRGMAALLAPSTRGTPCLRCIAPEPPAVGEVETCDAVGVLAATTGIVGSLEAAFVLRWIAGDASGSDAVDPRLIRFDLASGAFSSATLLGARDRACSCCGEKRFEFLDATHSFAQRVRVLCGRNAVEVPVGEVLDVQGIARVEAHLAVLGSVERLAYEDVTTLSVQWKDGQSAWSLQLIASTHATRLVVGGTVDPEVARGVVARVLG